MPESASLQAKQLSYEIAQKHILSDINLSLERGKVLGVLGPNGAGKTSLLKMLSGQTASKQQVEWCGKALEDFSPLERAKQIAVVNQLNESVFALSLQQIVRMGWLPHKTLLSRENEQDHAHLAASIAKVGLSDKTHQTFSSLSGGEQQRGLIARALVQKAALIVLDEPVNHLDIYYQHQVLKLLRTLAHQQQMTVVMSLHDINLAASYCDHLCLLNEGKMIAQGPVEKVLEAKTLEHVFNIPCRIRRDDLTQNLRVDFYPPDEQEHPFMPEVMQYPTTTDSDQGHSS
ncbi:ABC transporter ATP-binding protein [Paraglaciecola chathamensis]|jgi:iron complex transport system ATP-binding protein|uniref:ABC cobalamin uptake system ATPase BtuD n=3 Tax=Paraglaciecola chathamensis TaxID=368405 RepID=A0A8H9IB71_9ALTE|nr:MULTISPECIES: ABC transporter ATP-binding protein [Paraglaciecola]AEE24206.1 ABC transporter related protein [Glaciecola sp. 4H-3-7+YE-5]MBU3018441.1 ABC transporter ATP-binding protein [Paraglaciecola agarilytica]MDO6559230.1 ABC transporter ATP-binding protein [Paraglaciecola chathamensis]GAC07417.1 hemin import ATP-binding protein HmuV [Paraglaciecola agarilytica NO2]GAC10871.1 hemin import ATP-binding protein HmuV [Paraglaciecola chathamensis S18K6]